jgi:hypothetical protein
MNEKLNSVKAHLSKHRAKYAAAATVVACYAVHRLQVKEMNNFLTEHNLLDQYYNPEF